MLVNDKKNLAAPRRRRAGGAKEHYERALSIDKKFLASDHPRVINRVFGLLNVLTKSGQLDEVQAVLERHPVVMEIIREEEE